MYDTQEGLQETILAKAQHLEINPAKIALQEYRLPISSQALWWKPQEPDDAEDVYVKNVNLMSGIDNVLSRFATSVAESIQFPRSTVFLHGLGVVAAAMTENFFYSFNGRDENTVALYTVGAQPPSTGKSGVDSYFTSPIHKAYKEKNEGNEGERLKITNKLGKLKAAIKKAGGNEADEIALEIVDFERKLKEYPIYTWCINDPTPEGCEATLAKQNGFYNVVSDESSAVSVILGLVYGDGKKNNGVFLRAWDNGYLSVARAGRDGYEGNIRASVAVLAQDLSIEAILEAGQSGEGISERFLILREPNLLGHRDHTTYTPVNREYMEDYNTLMRNIVMTGYPVTLTLTSAAEQLIRSIKQDQEPLMADGGAYSTPMLRGVVGKNEKQIIKIASVLHVIKEWSDGGGRRTVIDTDCVFPASMIFNQLLKTYTAAADSKGFSGKKTENNRLIYTLKKFAGKSKMRVDIRAFRDAIKNSAEFKAMPKLTDRLRKEYIPELEKMAYLVHDEETDELWINPFLRY